MDDFNALFSDIETATNSLDFIDKLPGPLTRAASSSDLVPVTPHVEENTDIFPRQCDLEAELPPGIVADIQNVICSFSLRVEVDLKRVTFGLRTAEYNPRRCQAVLLRMRYPKTTAMIYDGGKVIITGATSEADGLYAAKKVTKTIQKVGYKEAVLSNFKVENIIARVDIEFPVRLEQLAYDYRLYATYEPELFAGCVYRMPEPKVSLLVFVTGKMMISGGRSVEEIDTALRIIYPILFRFQA